MTEVEVEGKLSIGIDVSVKQRCQRSKIFGAEALPLALLLKRMAHEADRIQEGGKEIYSLGYDWRNLP